MALRKVGLIPLGRPEFIIPTNAQLYYYFAQPDITQAPREQVNGQNRLISRRASSITIPQTRYGNVDRVFQIGEPAFDRAVNLQVWETLGGSSPDSEAVSTFTENGLWDDNSDDVPLVLGNLSNGTFINGVQDTTSLTPLITMVPDPSGVAGKYNGAGATVAIVGAQIIIGGFSIPVSSFTNQNTWQVNLTGTGITDAAELRALIGNDGTSSNPFSIDFTQSAYFTNPIAAGAALVRTLRINAGDSAAFLDSLPAPEILPEDNWKLEIQFTAFEDYLNFDRILEVDNPLDTGLRINTNTAGTQIRCSIDNTNNSVINAQIMSGSTNTISIRRELGVYTLRLNGVDGTSVVGASVNWGSAMRLMSAYSEAGRGFNSGVISVAITPI